MNSLKRFNELVIDLTRDIQHFLNDSDFRFYKQTAKAVTMINRSIMYNVFKQHAHKHVTKIMSRDDSLFSEKEFVYLMTDEFYTKFVKKCVTTWCNLNDKQKNIVWLYLQILILLHEQIQTI